MNNLQKITEAKEDIMRELIMIEFTDLVNKELHKE